MLLFIGKIMEGGPVFMFPILLMFIAVVVLFVKALIKKQDHKKAIRLIASISLFAAVWGVLGQVIALISAFDAIEAAGNISPAMLAGGLKVSFLTTAFGLFTFLVGRLGIIILTSRSN